MENQTQNKESELDRLFSIPASGVVFASGGALIGNTFGGPIGGLVGGAIGAVGGVVTELVSQKRHRMNSSAQDAAEQRPAIY